MVFRLSLDQLSVLYARFEQMYSRFDFVLWNVAAATSLRRMKRRIKDFEIANGGELVAVWIWRRIWKEFIACYERIFKEFEERNGFLDDLDKWRIWRMKSSWFVKVKGKERCVDNFWID